MELKPQYIYLSLGACQPAGDGQIKAVQRVGLHQPHGGKGLVGKAATWLGQVNSFTLEFPAALTAAEFLEVCTWLFSMTLTFSDGLHWKMESQQA